MSHPQNACIGQGVTFFFPLALYNMRRQWAALAQLVEHIIRNDGVRCSSHLGGTIFSTKPRELEGVKNNPPQLSFNFFH